MATQVRLDWAPNPAAEQVTKYIVLQSVNGGMEAEIATVTQPTLTLDNVAPGRYTWKVFAVNLAGSSAASQPASNPGVPSAPGTPTVTVTEV